VRAEEFAAGAAVLFGPSWRGRAAAALGVDESTLWRTTRPGHLVPGPTAACMRSWRILHGLFGTEPPASPFHLWIETTGAFVPPTHDRRWDDDPSAMLQETASALFGEGWERYAPAALGRNHTTLWRQIRNGRIPGAVIGALRAWKLIHDVCGMTPPKVPGAPFETKPKSEQHRRPSKSRYADLLD
jgi:hypothetical protein